MRMGFKSCYDISVKVGSESVDHPDAAPYSRRLVWEKARGGACDLSEVVMTAHTGTHVDAPSHFISGGKSIDRYPPADFILPAHVVYVDDRGSVKKEHLEGLRFEPGDALLFRTWNSVCGISRGGRLSRDYVGLSPEAAELCVQGKAGLVGIDCCTIDKHGDKSFSTHRKLLESEILILEGIDLHSVPEGRYTLLCLPIKIEGAEAAPVRAVLLSGD